MSQHPVELLFRDGQPLAVRAVHHQNDELQRHKSHSLTSFQTHIYSSEMQHGGWAFPGQAPHNGHWVTAMLISPLWVSESDPEWQKTKDTLMLWRSERRRLHQTTRETTHMTVTPNLHESDTVARKREVTIVTVRLIQYMVPIVTVALLVTPL